MKTVLQSSIFSLLLFVLTLGFVTVMNRIICATHTAWGNAVVIFHVIPTQHFKIMQRRTTGTARKFVTGLAL